MLYACDDTWWIAYFPEVVRFFRGEKWTVNANARDRFALYWIYGQDGPGLSKDPTSIMTGKNSGYQAIGLAALFGAARILLLGFDFGKSPSGLSHWHGDHPKNLGNGGAYSSWVAAMNLLARDLKAANIEVINCSRATAINCFERKPIEECL